MAPNATASKSAKTAAKKPSRQPPSDTVLGALSSVDGRGDGPPRVVVDPPAIIGVAVLVSLAYAWGFIKHNQQLPVEPVQFADAGGGGSKDGSGDGPGGEHKPPEEGVKSDKPNEGNTDKPAERVALNPVEMQKATQEFSAPDARYIQEGPESTKTFLDLDKDLRDKLRDGINPSKGNGGTGKDGGTGSGKDKGVGTGTGEGTGRMLNEREKRMLRWSMKFNMRNGADYLRQLNALGAILAVPVGPNGQFKVIRDLSRPHPPLLDEDLSQIQRIWWIDDNPRSVESLMAAMGYSNLRPSRVVAFIPPELEEELAKKELDFKGLKEDQIYETKFDVFVGGAKGYDVRVMDQQKK